MNSIKKIFVITLVILFSGYFESLCQIEKFEEFNPKNKDWELYVTFSTTGGGAGTKVKWGNRESIQNFFSFEISGVRGEDEYTTYVYDPYYGGLRPYKVNQRRYMMLVPMMFGMQKRLLKESIEDNFRPFLLFEAGPTMGIKFPVGHGFSNNLKKGKIGLTVGGFLGLGIEMGEVKNNAYIFSMGYRFAHFFNEMPVVSKELNEMVMDREKTFNAFVIRFGVITQF